MKRMTWMLVLPLTFALAACEESRRATEEAEQGMENVGQRGSDEVRHLGEEVEGGLQGREAEMRQGQERQDLMRPESEQPMAQNGEAATELRREHESLHQRFRDVERRMANAPEDVRAKMDELRIKLDEVRVRVDRMGQMQAAQADEAREEIKSGLDDVKRGLDDVEEKLREHADAPQP